MIWFPFSTSDSGYNMRKTEQGQETQKFKSRFQCPDCDRSYSQEGNLKRHQTMECGGKKNFVCHICHRGFTRKRNLQQHLCFIHKVYLNNFKKL